MRIKHIFKGSLYRMMTVMAILPLTIFGIVVSVYYARQFNVTMQVEIAGGLENMAEMMLNTYNLLYPGDFASDEDNGEIALYKGGTEISGTSELLDRMKEKTGVDLTIFYHEKRVLTTIRGSDGRRILNTVSSAVVMQDVYQRKEAHFYKSALVNGVEYFAYYMPILSSDGSCVGMAFAGKPAAKVHELINRAVFPIWMIVILAVFLAGWFAVVFSTKLVNAVKRMEHFLTGVAGGDLSDMLDDSILNREDELGRMGHAAVKMQRSLRELIEQDALTGLYNRRYGMSRLAKVRERAEYNGNQYAVVLGDIDFFKRVNDTYGHDCGDLVLKDVAKILKDNMLGYGTVVRWGGEEFLLIFEKDGMREAEKVTGWILERISACRMKYQGKEIKVTMTFGIAEAYKDEENDKLIKRADDKLYAGKLNGRNQIVS